MLTSVAIKNSLHSIFGNFTTRPIISNQAFNLGLHLLPIVDAEIILTRPEKLFDVVPRRTQQGNTTRQCFENANRWNPAESICVLPSRNMNSELALAISSRSTEVRKV